MSADTEIVRETDLLKVLHKLAIATTWHKYEVFSINGTKFK